MKVLCLLMDGSRRGHRLTLNLGVAVFGRAKGSKVRLPSERISRKHCRLWLEKRKIWVQDLGSQNGTYVNDEVVVGKVEINDGDELKVGHIRFRLKFVADKEETDGERIPVRRETSPGSEATDSDQFNLVPLDEPPPGDFDLPLEDEDVPGRPSETFDIPVQDPMDFRDILRELDEGSEDD